MDDPALERQATELRARLLELWGGDAKRADKYLCWLMQHMITTMPGLPVERQDIDRAMRLMAMLMQR